MAQFLPVAGDDHEISPADGRRFTVPELEFFVGGFFDLFALTDGRVMVVNTNGKVMQLAPNTRATALVKDRLAPADVIVGDVIVCTPSDVCAMPAPGEV